MELEHRRENVTPTVDSGPIPYGRHFVDEDDIAMVADLLRNGPLTQGPMVTEFENAVCKYVGVRFGVAVSSWTAGLHLMCMAAGVKKGDVVITTPLSFVASANAAVYVGAEPAFADIDLETGNMDPMKLEEQLKFYAGRVKAIIPVHFGGLPVDTREINRLAKKYGAVVLEDAAHALGAWDSEDHRIGACENSLMSGFSFHPVKGIACGEGGIITTNDEAVYRRLLRLRSHGINKGDDVLMQPSEAFSADGSQNPWYYEMQELGYHYRITDIQCALGLSQLRKFPLFLARRIELAERYDKAFSSFKNLAPLQSGLRKRSGNHLYVVRFDLASIGMTKAEIVKALRERGIQTQVHYIPIPTHPFYRENYPTPSAIYANAMKHYQQALTLPLFPTLTDEQQTYVIECLRQLIE